MNTTPDPSAMKDALWRHLYRSRSLERTVWQGAVKSALLQQKLLDIMADYMAGTISTEQYMAQVGTAYLRVSTMYLMLSFPLEERVN